MSESKKTPEIKSRDWRDRWYEIIFEADTRAGKAFDVILLIAILLSVLVIMLESVNSLDKDYDVPFHYAEWFFTILFTIEYVARIICARHPLRYIFSFYGVVDLLSILPTYIMNIAPGETQRLGVIRALRLLRAFRIFKLAHMLSEASELRRAIWASRSKVAVFLATVLIAVVIEGAALHLIEDDKGSGFDSIPESMYWAIVTMTTVGYGDSAPVTPLGKFLASLIMILGYSLIIVPTGIVSAELAHGARASDRSRITTQVCPECMREGHDSNATFCKFCGARL
ncbi:ion transporter [Gimesia sp.]|uniref:ion transporter n=1 Tax=Gimesia sp. TaxID=2024833 RepID=UPI000C3735C4|nr:ion transporter [Gimesia sp.]MAX35545.1 ion transporter [Gimesia sp.]HAH44087.1 ion transporter [Planctomycetaceae bacterium]HBL42664.1 ion transporter [Planctomycetaceae bacterium]|tara:strand:- start:34271 stop:35122 length:852 start_codon:yes stop_codon:yes gene_type:complete